MRIIFAAIVCTLIAMAQPASAEVMAKPTALDNRIREFVYTPNQVYRISGRTGYVQSIIFGKGEVIETVQIGDSATWKTEVHKSGDRIAIKPITVPDTPTNLTVRTDRHTYTFYLTGDETDTVEAFRYQFTYPEPEKIEMVQSNIAAFYQARDAGQKITTDYLGTGDPILTPTTIWDDGAKTYVTLSPLATRAAIFEIVDGKERLINSRDLKDGTIVLDGVYPQISIRDGKHYACVFNRPLHEFLQEARATK